MTAVSTSTRRVACLAWAALGACGGSGGGTASDGGRAPGGAPIESSVTGGALTGRVRDAVTGAAIPGVEVRLMRASGDDVGAPGPEVARVATRASGEYAFADVARDTGYAIAFDAAGYRDELYTGVAPDETGDTVLDAVGLVSDDNAGTGRLAGRVVDAVDGSGVANARLDFRAGINRRSGEVLVTTDTAADGGYLVDGLEHGNVTVQVDGEGIARRHATFQVLGDLLTTDRDIAVVPVAGGTGVVGEGELRIVLTWGERPADLDAHLTGPAPGGAAYFHVFPADREADDASLSSDATMGAGPETIVIDRLEPGVHRYSVFNFSGDIDLPLERSGARVEVLRDGASVADFAVPTGEGNLWTVFDIDGGRIVPIDTLSRLRNVLDHFPPSGRDLARLQTIPGMTGRFVDGDGR